MTLRIVLQNFPEFGLEEVQYDLDILIDLDTTDLEFAAWELQDFCLHPERIPERSEPYPLLLPHCLL